MKNLVVVGLGYVGLPLALLARKKGYEVTGLDVDDNKLNSLENGVSYIDDIEDAEIKEAGVDFTNEASVVGEADAVIICVPTPVNHAKEPDLGPVRSAIKSIAPHLKTDALVVVESTINPGVCDEVVVPLLEETSGKKVGEDVYLAHCPERINPGDPKWNVSNINRVIGANSPKELEIAKQLYESLIDAEVKPMGSLKEAEAVKIVENSFRDINIAFVNELAKSFHKLGINLENVIDGAATKPFAFMPHHPGCGVGGHCIPVDPYYLIEYAHGYGFEHEFLRLARSINESMPEFTVDLLEEALNELELPIKGTKVALLGLSYKANVGDDRESPAYEIKKILEERGADLVTFDPYIKSDVSSLDKAMSHAEAIVIATAHKEFKELSPEHLKDFDIKAIIDGRNTLKNVQFSGSEIIYHGVGV